MFANSNFYQQRRQPPASRLPRTSSLCSQVKPWKEIWHWSLLLFTGENPCAPKDYIMNHLPVIWHSNCWAWVTTSTCQNYVIGFTRSTVQQATYWTGFWQLWTTPQLIHLWRKTGWQHKMVFLPHNTFFLHFTDVCVVSTFKAYYQLACCLSWWWGWWRRQANFASDTDNIFKAWEKVKESTVNRWWKKLWPESVKTASSVSVTMTLTVVTISTVEKTMH